MGSRPGHVGFVVDSVALGQAFSEYFGFPCQLSFHRMLQTYLSRAVIIGHIAADVTIGFSLAPPRKIKIVSCFGDT
jgi:hypothetical protein